MVAAPLGANATTVDGYAFFDDGAARGVLLDRLAHRNAAPHVAVLAVLVAAAAYRVLVVVLTDLGFVRDAVAGLLARCGCCDAEAFFRDLIEQQGHDFPDYYAALSTACLERNLAQKLLKKGILKKYKEELDKRRHKNDVDEKHQYVRIQGLESYNFKLNPTYVAKFALDSKTIQMAEASDSTTRSLRCLSMHSADDWQPHHPEPDPRGAKTPGDAFVENDDEEAGVYGFGDTHAHHLPPSPRKDGNKHAKDAGRHVKRGSIWVEEREPDGHELHMYHTDGGVHHAHAVIDVAQDHLVSEATRRRASVGPAWHERWAHDEALAAEGRRSLQSPSRVEDLRAADVEDFVPRQSREARRGRVPRRNGARGANERAQQRGERDRARGGLGSAPCEGPFVGLRRIRTLSE